jgi:hypothetical protein
MELVGVNLWRPAIGDVVIQAAKASTEETEQEKYIVIAVDRQSKELTLKDNDDQVVERVLESGIH